MALSFINSPTIYAEIGRSSIKVVDGTDGLELSLDRLENGRLTPLCAERVAASLRVFLKRHSWRSRVRAICAINASGVSLRRLALPGNASDQQLEPLIALQIEREFPMAPEELAWGYCRLPGGEANETAREVLVAAVKKDIIDEYARIFEGCGLSPVFTLSALARNAFCPSQPGAYALLDVGRRHSELVCFREGAPENIRVFNWGGENITRAIESRLGIPHAEAERMKLNAGVAGLNGDTQPDDIIRDEVQRFARTLPVPAGGRLYVTGGGARVPEFGNVLCAAVGNGAGCEWIDSVSGEGQSAAIAALRRNNGQQPALILRPGVSRIEEKPAQPATIKWAVLAVVLLAATLALRYAEAFTGRARLTNRLSALKVYRDSLPRIERELALFEYLRTNQPGYLEPLYALANAAPSGTRIESISMSRRGDLSLRATMKDPQQLVQMRSKLAESGLFSAVVVEEQTPSSDRQKLQVRMSGQWKVAERVADLPATGTNKMPTAARQGTNSATRLGATPPKP